MLPGSKSEEGREQQRLKEGYSNRQITELCQKEQRLKEGYTDRRTPGEGRKVKRLKEGYSNRQTPGEGRNYQRLKGYPDRQTTELCRKEQQLIVTLHLSTGT